VSLATVTTSLRHVVRLVHASTGAPVRGLSARLEPAAYGWSVRTLPDAVVVSARKDVAEPPTPPQAVVTLTDGRVADVLVIPTIVGRPPRTIVVDLTAEQVDAPVHPVPMTLTAVLSDPTTGEPRTGVTVVATATSGPDPKPTVPLPEVEPGTYRSAPVEWTAAFTPLDLLVGGNPLRTLAVDFTRPATTIHVVDTT
jgi:hypothetical protein